MEQLQAVVENRTGFCLDPRTKLLLMAVVATAEFLYSHTAFMVTVAMIPFILLLTNRQYKTATVFFCLFAAGLFVQAIQNSVQFPMIVNMLVVLLVGLVLRLFPAFVMGAALTRGLDNPVRRTNITKVGFTGWDLLAVLIAGAALLSTYFFSPW